jgi:mono/diheme cytochrome c family protein
MKTMSWLCSLKPRLRTGLGLALVVAASYAASIAVVAAADTKAAKNTKPEKKTEKKTEKKKLTGAELYAIHCNRCHAERYPTEWTSAQWKTLMLHMRVRANLPAAQAKTIVKYLQEDSGN